MSHKRFSIITVTYNVDKVLERTLNSIQSQTAFDCLEHIIVDGNSTDNTLNIIKQHDSKISQWISEPDNGLYDAMNKGIAMASGEYVWFINAGDELFDKNTVENLLPFCTDKPLPHVLYGDTKEYSAEGEELGMRRLKVPKKLDWKSFKQGMLVCHQSILVRRDIAPFYNLDYKISSDVDWVINALKLAPVTVNTQAILSKFEKGGLSGKHIKKALRERFAIMRKHYGLINTTLHHFYFPLRLASFYIRNKRI